MIATQTMEPKAREYSPTAEDFAALLRMNLWWLGAKPKGCRQGQDRRHRKRPRRHRCGPENGGPRPLKEFGYLGAISRPFMWATRSRFMSSASRTPSAKRCFQRDKARREEGWTRLEQNLNAEARRLKE